MAPFFPGQESAPHELFFAASQYIPQSLVLVDFTLLQKTYNLKSIAVFIFKDYRMQWGIWKGYGRICFAFHIISNGPKAELARSRVSLGSWRRRWPTYGFKVLKLNQFICQTSLRCLFWNFQASLWAKSQAWGTHKKQIVIYSTDVSDKPVCVNLCQPRFCKTVERKGGNYNWTFLQTQFWALKMFSCMCEPRNSCILLVLFISVQFQRLIMLSMTFQKNNYCK